MKKLLLLNVILIAFSAPVQAATVKAFATEVLETYGGFTATPGGSALTNTDIQPIISSNTDTAVYGQSAADYSVIDLGFGGTSVFTGSGADLVIFSLWQGYNYNFELEVFSKEGLSLSAYTYQVTGDACAAPCSPTVKTTAINLFGSGTTPTLLENNIELGYLRLFIGGDLATDGFGSHSNFSLVGAFNTEITEVPLPLPALLFGSGLGLLGLIGRRRKSKA